MNRLLPAAAATVYVGSIVAANIATDQLGMIGVGFGLLVTAGTFAAGFALLARDVLHETAGPTWRRWVFSGIAVGAVLSWLLASPGLAAASTAAFTLAELADLGVYARLRNRGFAPAALASNAVGAPLDTAVFLILAPFPLTWPAFAGQLIGKWVWATALPVGLYLIGRHALLRQPVHADGT